MKKNILAYITIYLFMFQNIEDRCFVNEKDNRDGDYKEEIPYTVQQILNEKPDYLKLKT